MTEAIYLSCILNTCINPKVNDFAWTQYLNTILQTKNKKEKTKKQTYFRFHPRYFKMSVTLLLIEDIILNYVTIWSQGAV